MSDGPLEPGARIERFEVVQILGSGGSAHVYRVRHTTLGSDHALKLLTSAHASLADRLAQEGRVQAKLRHPNIVAVTDVVEHEGRAGLVMEFVSGPTLDQWLKDRGPLPPLDAVRLMDGVMSAVAAAHAADVLHRDLKPANVLLEEGPHGIVARVTDFGIAKVFNEDARAGHTRSGLAMGTPGYMAPEQWADASAADASADVFALGVMLYELMTGARPYDGDGATAVLDATVTGRHTPLQDRDVDPEIAAVIERAILPDPGKRYASVTAFREALLDAARIRVTAAPTFTLASMPASLPTAASMPPGPRSASTLPPIDARAARSVPYSRVALALVAPVFVGVAALGIIGAGIAWWISEAAISISGGSSAASEQVRVEGGPFFFGPDAQAVDVATFQIDRTEVSTADYLRCVQAKVCSEPAWRRTSGVDYVALQGQRQPIVGVSWSQANTFCAWRHGRLPTDVEWERAATWSPDARDASDKRAWPWGDAPPSCALANYEACRPGTTVEVTDLGSGASAYGIVNLTGNAWEWTSTEYDTQKRRGLFHRARSERVLKGGGFNAAVEDIAPVAGFHAAEDSQSPLYGFRCAYDPP